MTRIRSIVLLVILALCAGGVTAYAAAGDPCNAKYPAGSLSASQKLDNLKAYTECREDRQDAALARIEAKLNSSPTSTPSPSVTPSPSASPTPTKTPTPSPTATSTAAGKVCTSPAFTFTGQGSRGIAGGYDASAEQWGVNGYNYKSTMGVCDHDSWFVDVTTDNTKGDGAVKSYPSMRRIYHDWSTSDFSKDPRLSSFPKLSVDFAATEPASCTGCIYDTAFDIWANGIGGSNNTELMIWTVNAGQRPYGSKVASSIVVDGLTWDLWSGNSDHYIAYVPTDGKPIASGTLDVKAFFADLISRNRIAATSLPGGTTDPYIGQISYGVEPVSTNGVSRHWDFTRFNVTEK